MNNKKIVVLGGGESGTGAAVLAKQKGFDVFLSDAGSIKPIYKAMLEKYQIDFEENKHSEAIILQANEIIKSPGIPDNTALMQKIKANNINVISEIEFAWRYTNAKLIGITGTNGKTTTTLLVYHILKNAGFNVGLAGNIGKSFALQVAENNFDYYVLELSSFQLDGLQDFKLDNAILLNITPDHLDRYGNDMEQYIQSKLIIMNNQTENDNFIYCADDENITKHIVKKHSLASMYPFSIKTKMNMAAYKDEGTLKVNVPNQTFEMPIDKLSLRGQHNLYNSMAASVVANLLAIRKETIRESLEGFKPAEHRLEPVLTIRGVEFINDSKATNINSTWYALESMTKPTIWIVGGQDKGNDYTMLYDLVKAKVKAIVCLGVDNQKIVSSFKHIIPTIIETKSAKQAVEAAYHLAKQGDAVLLSPACASFDLFKNYEDRGNQFKKAVSEL